MTSPALTNEHTLGPLLVEPNAAMESVCYLQCSNVAHFLLVLSCMTIGCHRQVVLVVPLVYQGSEGRRS